MTDPKVVRRQIRRRIHSAGADINVAADVNALISTGDGGAASSVQRTTIRQDARARAARGAMEPTDSQDVPEKEQ